MQYENPPPREGINYSSEHPLKEFAQLVLGIGVLVVTVIVLVHLFAGSLARQIPHQYEEKMVANFDLAHVEPSARQAYLQNLAERLLAHMDMPAGMRISVHYNDDDIVNAFATLGGHIVFFQGLLNKLDSEEAIAMVMAHELAHIKLRHPISALGKGVLLATLAATVGGASGSAAGDWLIGNSTNLSLLKFSRDQERAADREAAAAVFAEYGHLGGAQMLFAEFQQLEQEHQKYTGDSRVVQLFRSHPYSRDRWQALQTLAEKHGWEITGLLSPAQLPAGAAEE